jgi:hypothetical protein
MKCAYCGGRAVNMDHVIPHQARHRFHGPWSSAKRPKRCAVYYTADGRIVPDDLLGTVPSCFNCNIAKGPRLLIPPSWSHRLDELNELGIGTFRVWDGSVELLRTTA